MTLDEVIKQNKEAAKKLRKIAEGYNENLKHAKGGEVWYFELKIEDRIRDAEEHEQLADWLTELKAYKACPLMQNECYFCRADRCHNGGQKNGTENRQD